SDKVLNSFASVLKHKVNRVAEIIELRNDECVEGAAVTIPLAAIEEVTSRFKNTLYGYFVGKRLAYQVVENYVKNVWAKYGLKRIQLHGEFFLFQFDNKEDMNKFLDYGAWLIRRVPLLLNIWSPNSDLHKAEIKKVPIWVKLYNVPIVAYSEVGLSLITTQIGKPIQLDTYTSDMCLNSWGRSASTRALIEISADDVLKEDSMIAIPVGKDKVVTPAVVTNVELNLSKDVADDGFEGSRELSHVKAGHLKFQLNVYDFQRDGIEPNITWCSDTSVQLKQCDFQREIFELLEVYCPEVYSRKVKGTYMWRVNYGFHHEQQLRKGDGF
nr:zinc knuckle CX2CX4HX4C [Tanacetum cinerariifolium]